MAAPSRLGSCLAALGDRSRAALVPYFCVGDPDMDTSLECVLAAADAGADAIELGVPFSDPMADGPIIQAASQRALAAGSSLPAILELVAEVRRRSDVPLVLFGYYNPFFRFGHETLARDAAAAGVDGLLTVDLPPEEALPLVKGCRRHGLDRIFLVAPNSGRDRIEKVARLASGFVYLVSVTGVTGVRSVAPQGIERLVGRVREVAGLPVGVGFGISTPAQAAEVAAYADLVIVGSALVSAVHAAGRRDATAAVKNFVGDVAAALDAVGGGPKG